MPPATIIKMQLLVKIVSVEISISFFLRGSNLANNNFSIAL